MGLHSSRLIAPAARVERQRVLYFSRVDLPSTKANSIQTMNTCLELARGGVEVVLVVRRLQCSRRDCFAYYGLPPHPRLRVVSLSLPLPTGFNDWEGPYFRTYLASLLRRYRRPGTVLFTRDPAGLDLLAMVHRLRSQIEIPTYFEVHRLDFRPKASHQEERGRFRRDPRGHAKVEARHGLESEVYAAVDGIVCTSENALQLLDLHFPEHAPACVVPSGARMAAEIVPLDDAGRDLDVVYVGQLDRWRGVGALIAAMAHLPGRRLTIVGGNDPQDIARGRAHAREAGVADRVEFLGQVPPTAVSGWLQRARVGVVPLPEAGFIEDNTFTSPLEVFEFMQAGVPMVASDLPSIREWVRHGEHALLVAPDDPAALGAGIKRLLQDRALAARLVDAARAHVRAFTWERRAQRLLEFIASPQAMAGSGG